VTRRSPIRLSRRRLLAASGATLAAGAPAAFAACGTTEEEDEADEVSPAREAELLNAVIAQQLGVARAAAEALRAAPDEIKQPIARLHDRRGRSVRDLNTTVTDLGGEPTAEATELVGAESAVEGLARQLETSIGASLDAIGELTPEPRQAVHRAITEDAATLAAIRDVLGEEPAPDAFVFGPPAKSEAAS
jgi:hypothetical protein